MAVLGVIALLAVASIAGWGLERPEKKPMSIREGSAKVDGGPQVRTRYFIGGGLHSGK